MNQDMRDRYKLPESRPSAPVPAPQPPTDLRPAVQFNRPATPPSAAQTLPEPTQPLPQAAQLPSKPVTKPKTRRRPGLKLITALVILAGLAGGGAFWYTKVRADTPIPQSILSSVNYPVLYPTQLPSGYTLNPASYSKSEGTLIYTAGNGSSNPIAFSVEPRPSNFNFSLFYTQGLNNAATFNTSVGQAAIGKANGHSIGSLLTDQSWMLIRFPSDKVPSSDIRLVLNSVKIADK